MGEIIDSLLSIYIPGERERTMTETEKGPAFMKHASQWAQTKTEKIIVKHNISNKCYEEK